MDARTRQLLEAPIGRTLLRLAFPNIVVMAVQSAIGLIETYFVAKLGTDALAGMALVFPVLMTVVMVSAGAMGGGILSAIARSLGANRHELAETLAWNALFIALTLGILTSIAALLGGSALYTSMGGTGGALAAALVYSNVTFLGAVPLWLYNSLAAIIRGTGNMALPAIITAAGAVVLIPLSPMLIFGFGPLPSLGIAGGAAAVVIFYIIGCAIFAFYIWSGRGVLHPRLRTARVNWTAIVEIMRVGLGASVNSLATNISIAVATALCGVYGPAAVAGFGTASRLEYFLIPLVFGLGAPLAAMVGTAIGAGHMARALRVAWTGVFVAFLMTETIGLVAAAFPDAWLVLFGTDPTLTATGAHYLRIVGPFYGVFGAGLALFFASQGAGRIGWPVVAALTRVAIAAGGGVLIVHHGGGIEGVFAMLAVALTVYGAINMGAVAAGAWTARPRAGLPQAAKLPAAVRR